MLSWLFSLFSVMFSVWSYVVMCQHSSSLNTQKVCTCWHLSICTLVRVLIFSYSVPVFFLAQIFASNWQNSKQTKQTNNSTVNKQTNKKMERKKNLLSGSIPVKWQYLIMIFARVCFCCLQTSTWETCFFCLLLPFITGSYSPSKESSRARCIKLL